MGHGSRSNGSRRGQRNRSTSSRQRYNPDITRCVCGRKQEEGLFMIQCDECQVWQHGECVNLPDKKYCPESYFCELCRPEDHPYLLLTPPADAKRTSATRPAGAPYAPVDKDDDHRVGNHQEDACPSATDTVPRSRRPSQSSRPRPPRSPKTNKPLRPAARGAPPSPPQSATTSTSTQPSDAAVPTRPTTLALDRTNQTWLADAKVTGTQSLCPSPTLPTDSKRSYESDDEVVLGDVVEKKRRLGRTTSARTAGAAQSSAAPSGASTPLPHPAEADSANEDATSVIAPPPTRRRTSTKKPTKNARKSSTKARGGRRNGTSDGSQVSTPTDSGHEAAATPVDKEDHRPSPLTSADLLRAEPYVCKVTYPSPGMSLGDMRKRACLMLEYVTRVQDARLDRKLTSTTRPVGVAVSVSSPAAAPLSSSPVHSPASQTMTESTDESATSSIQLIDMLTRDLIRFQEMLTS
ncbi:Histone deacetylase complex subunit [Tieghemiomyces parasiticus]|uniref:Histone deacetylase complex subunit n=1 Tax=Tieghemiomyces parasiticus TaxID=78921 RepID=A0A9W7ZU33_9FUNG|nr:Histone deacetylase complex subunit [Tieghemiomyces parasiticus]